MRDKNKKAVVWIVMVIFALGIFLFIRVAGSEKTNKDSQEMAADFPVQEESGAYQEEALTVELTIEDHYNKSACGVPDSYSNMYYIDENNVLWGRGRNHFGQLGQGTQDYELYTDAVKIAEDVIHVDYIQTGFVIYLTEDHKLYGMGTAQSGALQQYEKLEQISSLDENKSAVTSPYLLMEDVIYACCGRNDVVCLAEDSSVWIWGIIGRDNGNNVYFQKPQKVLENCVLVTGGKFNHAALLRDGSVWTWGYNYVGNCGVAEKRIVEEPTKVAEDAVMVWTGSIQNENGGSVIAELKSFYGKQFENTIIQRRDGTYLICGDNVGTEERTIALYYDFSYHTTVCTYEFKDLSEYMADQENYFIDRSQETDIVMDKEFFDDSDTCESIALVQGEDEGHMLFVVRTVDGKTFTFDAPGYIWGLNYVYAADLNGDGSDEIVIEYAQTAYFFGACIIDVVNQCFLEVPHTSQDSHEVGINYGVLAVDENSIEITNEDTGYDEMVDMERSEILEMNHFSDLTEERKKYVLASLRGYGDDGPRIGASMEMSHIYIVEYEGRECLAIWQNLMVSALDRNSSMGHMETLLSYDSQGDYHIVRQRYVKYDALLVSYKFQQEDIVVEPKVQEYSFEDAAQTGEVWEIKGILPSASVGTWYIVDIEDVEYYYGKYDNIEPETYFLFGWSIVGDSYELANGIKVGMNESDIIDRFQGMAVIGFRDSFIYDETGRIMGWNEAVYPHSYVGIDSDWNYNERDYRWTDQFDHVMVADINLNDSDAQPLYLGLLIKDNAVAAITFYDPTAD